MKHLNWPLLGAAAFTLFEFLGWALGLFQVRAGLPAFVTLFLVTWLLLWVTRAAWRLFWRVTHRPAGEGPADLAR
ncbi:MAG: hypothetical protein MUC42_05200 [Bryobacter sp.]|jgi:TRAP-type uncharacterized transport system fused permease subunit|nr:hypothetical protein [Bryobacter sp.]